MMLLLLLLLLLLRLLIIILIMMMTIKKVTQLFINFLNPNVKDNTNRHTCSLFSCNILVYQHQFGFRPVLRLKLAGIHTAEGECWGDWVLRYQGKPCCQQPHPNTAICVSLLENTGYHGTCKATEGGGWAHAVYRINVQKLFWQIKWDVMETEVGVIWKYEWK